MSWLVCLWSIVLILLRVEYRSYLLNMHTPHDANFCVMGGLSLLRKCNMPSFYALAVLIFYVAI
jgi:hypothetical protein